jgi:hypothetical protein
VKRVNFSRLPSLVEPRFDWTREPPYLAAAFRSKLSLGRSDFERITLAVAVVGESKPMTSNNDAVTETLRVWIRPPGNRVAGLFGRSVDTAPRWRNARCLRRALRLRAEGKAINCLQIAPDKS